MDRFFFNSITVFYFCSEKQAKSLSRERDLVFFISGFLFRAHIFFLFSYLEKFVSRKNDRPPYIYDIRNFSPSSSFLDSENFFLSLENVFV